MSAAPVDVLAVIQAGHDELCDAPGTSEARYRTIQDLRAARDAVRELIEAATEARKWLACSVVRDGRDFTVIGEDGSEVLSDSPIYWRSFATRAAAIEALEGEMHGCHTRIAAALARVGAP